MTYVMIEYWPLYCILVLLIVNPGGLAGVT